MVPREARPLTAGWLFLGAGPVRTAVTWVALAALAGCILAITGYVLRAGRVTPRRAYELALEAERTPAAGVRSAVPGALHGSRWTWARITAVALATFRTEVHRGVGHVGDTFPVAHTPGRPELGAVGARLAPRSRRRSSAAPCRTAASSSSPPCG
ncbi:hypothetical protein ACH4SK_42275 [Streptomyces inhibens]|uniref:hypothetical protein n=1 Tax=Streptomyces inhibens TaxID=2293571 RepID=UPI0037A9FCEB